MWQALFQVRMKQSARSNCLVTWVSQVGNSNSLIWSQKLEGWSWDIFWRQKISFRLAIFLSWKCHHGGFILLDPCISKYYQDMMRVRIPWPSIFPGPSPRDSEWKSLSGSQELALLRKLHPSNFDAGGGPDVEKYGMEVKCPSFPMC